MAPRDDRDPTGIPRGSRRWKNAVLKQLLRQNSNFATGESFAGVALAVKSVNNANYVVRCEVNSDPGEVNWTPGKEAVDQECR